MTIHLLSGYVEGDKMQSIFPILLNSTVIEPCFSKSLPINALRSKVCMLLDMKLGITYGNTNFLSHALQTLSKEFIRLS